MKFLGFILILVIAESVVGVACWVVALVLPDDLWLVMYRSFVWPIIGVVLALVPVAWVTGRIVGIW